MGKTSYLFRVIGFRLHQDGNHSLRLAVMEQMDWIMVFHELKLLFFSFEFHWAFERNTGNVFDP